MLIARTHRLLTFFLLTFTVAWGAWAVAISIWSSAVSFLRWPVFLTGVFAPGIVALGLTARSDGRPGVSALLRRIVRWRVPLRWYLFATGCMAAIKLTAALIHRLVTGTWPRFGETPWPLLMLAIVTSAWAQAGEEVGWRGYALPVLAARIGLARGSVLLGAIWAVWHLPLFFWAQADTYGQSFPVYCLQVMALSVAMAWLYWRAGGSLLLVMLMHAAVNNTKDIVPSAVQGAMDPFSLRSSLVAWLSVGLLWVLAAILLFRMRAAHLDSATAEPLRVSAAGT